MREKFRPTEWTVECENHTYKAIGYEQRGIFGVPIACIIDEEYISCTVYEIINGFRIIESGEFIGADELNEVEIALLKRVGCTWDGCWITKTDGEECDPAEIKYECSLDKYNMFKNYLEFYILHCPDVDETVFRFYKNLKKWVNTPDDIDECQDNKVCFILWLEDNWGAWLQSILDNEYKYMNLTQIVWESWKEV